MNYLTIEADPMVLSPIRDVNYPSITWLVEGFNLNNTLVNPLVVQVASHLTPFHKNN